MNVRINILGGDNNAICPYCKTRGCLEEITTYCDVIYETWKCINDHEWNRMYHYIGNSPAFKHLNWFEQDAIVIYNLKKKLLDLQHKITESPNEYKLYIPSQKEFR